MRSDARLLVIGPTRFRQAVERALPRCQPVAAESALSGVWQVGQQPFDGVLLSLSAGQHPVKAVRSLRRLAPGARIVVTCSPADEPGARRALQAGADDYVIEPLTREDLEQTLQIPPPARPAAAAVVAPPVEPSWQEKAQFVEVLKNLNEGPRATLERLAALLRQTFAADCATVEIDGLSATAGESGQPVLEEPIHREDAIVGAVVLGRPREGTYGISAAARLGDYARLIETVMTAARERVHWQDLAWSDDLSRLRNRRYFERRFDELIAQCARQRTHLTVLLFESYDFKNYNDRFGHEVGDALIREVAYLLTRCSRESDVVARYGGDEFAVIFWDAEKPRVPGSRHPSEPVDLAERFRQVIGAHNFKCLGAEAPGPVTISGGLASFPWDGHTREQLVRAADEALLAAKRTGKNRIELADDTPPSSEPEAPARAS